MGMWTKENEQRLAELWQSYDDCELADIFGTTVEAIKAKRRRLGMIRKQKTINNTKIYSYNEVVALFTERNLELLETEYKNYTTKMRYICNKHTEHGEQVISLCEILRGRGCYWCGREHTIVGRRTSEEELRRLCEEKDFTYVGRYFKNHVSYVQYICNKHPEEGVQEKHITNFRNAVNCPHCKESKGEKAVGNYLREHNYKYTSQKRFSDCRDKYSLPFDFYLEDYNIAIEYDGELHYMPVPLNSQKSSITQEKQDRINEVYKNQVRRDQIKNKYCIDKNISLLRIPYWELNNISNYLDKELSKIIA